METEELLRRAQDLWERCDRTGVVTTTGFLTPAQQAALLTWQKSWPDCQMVLLGGPPQAERKAAFFLPDWMTQEDFEPEEHLKAVCITTGFGTPGHRDYLGSILGLGIRREWIGDLILEDNQAYVPCMPSVQPALLSQLEHVGKFGVKVAPVQLAEIPQQERKVRPVSFTVSSLRLDAVCAGLFRLSRSQAAEKIRLGLVQLNYVPCQRPDAPVKEGDLLSLRGSGKGCVCQTGGTSRKGRLFLRCELWL